MKSERRTQASESRTGPAGRLPVPRPPRPIGESGSAGRDGRPRANGRHCGNRAGSRSSRRVLANRPWERPAPRLRGPEENARSRNGGRHSRSAAHAGRAWGGTGPVRRQLRYVTGRGAVLPPLPFPGRGGVRTKPRVVESGLGRSLAMCALQPCQPRPTTRPWNHSIAQVPGLKQAWRVMPRLGEPSAENR